MSGTNGRRIGRIGFVMDRRLSRERRAALTRAINKLRQHGFVDVWDTDEEAVVLQNMANESYQLIFAPWALYRKWNKIEGALGLSRTSGPTFCAYIGEPLAPAALEDFPLFQRLMLFDFTILSPDEVAILVCALARDTHRNGIHGLVSPQAPVYCENWMAHQGIGTRIDTLLSLPEMKDLPWSARGSQIRIALLALWSLIYEEGPGKAEVTQITAPGSPKAYFQAAFDSNMLVMRLFYSHKTPNVKKLIEVYWPNPNPSTQPHHSASQILLRHADFVRVQSVQDTGDVEIVCGFFRSAPSDQAPQSVRTLWIEPIAPSLVTEVPYELPNKDAPRLKAFPQSPAAPASAARTMDSETEKKKDRLLRDAAEKMIQLKKLVHEKDTVIQELRSGGVGTAAPLPPPDAEALLEAFQHRYFDAKGELQQIEAQIAALEARGSRDPSEVTRLKQRMATLAKQETDWMRSLAKIIADYRETKRRAGTGG